MSNLAITANFTQGSSGGTDCSSSTNLSSGGQCLIAIAFTPMQSGVLNGTLTLIDNALNNQSSVQSVQLSGSGLQLAQTITFTTNAPATAAYNSNFTVAATASSNLPVVYMSAGACTNSGATYTMTSGTGTCTVIVNQPGNGNYSPAPQVTQTAKRFMYVSQTHHVHELMRLRVRPTNSNFTVAAAASSGLTVVYTSAERARTPARHTR